MQELYDEESVGKVISVKRVFGVIILDQKDFAPLIILLIVRVRHYLDIGIN